MVYHDGKMDDAMKWSRTVNVDLIADNIGRLLPERQINFFPELPRWLYHDSHARGQSSLCCACCATMSTARNFWYMIRCIMRSKYDRAGLIINEWQFLEERNRFRYCDQRGSC